MKVPPSIGLNSTSDEKNRTDRYGAPDSSDVLSAPRVIYDTDSNSSAAQFFLRNGASSTATSAAAARSSKTDNACRPQAAARPALVLATSAASTSAGRAAASISQSWRSGARSHSVVLSSAESAPRRGSNAG